MHTGSPSVFRGDWVCAVAWLLVSIAAFNAYTKLSNLDHQRLKRFRGITVHAWLTSNTRRRHYRYRYFAATAPYISNLRYKNKNKMGRKGGGGMRVKQMGGPTKEQKAMMKQMAEGGGMGGGNPMDQFMIPPDQMINLPPTPNRKAQIFWPMHETFSMDPKTFFIIYPSYMDSCKTMKLGRRVGIENSIPTPTVNDISEGLQILNLRHVLEPHKGYSRDPTTLWDNPGRVKVEPTGGQYTKRSLLIELSSIIITLPSRIRRIEVIAAVEKAKEIKRQEQQEEKKKLAISSNQPKASKLPTSKNKKKGKKKR